MGSSKDGGGESKKRKKKLEEEEKKVEGWKGEIRVEREDGKGENRM